ncbi:MAG: hypothetical protein KKD31_18395 [Bacteroidetes bacterium]|nr:hypothetical protein [Bacteroidota bacterium]
MNRIWISLIIVSIALGACSHGKKDMLEQIAKAEKAVKSGDNSQKQELRDMYMEYARKFSDEKDAAIKMFNACLMEYQDGKSRNAVVLLDEMVNLFPDAEVAAEGLFLKGYIFEVNLLELDSAKICYELFMKKFPKHDRANDVRISLDNLGKSPEQLLKQQLAMQPQDSVPQ